jgi:hypothetical protein
MLTPPEGGFIQYFKCTCVLIVDVSHEVWCGNFHLGYHVSSY